MAAANNFFASLSPFCLFILVRTIFKRQPMEPGMKRHIVAIGEKNRQVCQQLYVAINLAAIGA